MEFRRSERISDKVSDRERELEFENTILERDLEAKKQQSLEDGIAAWNDEITTKENKKLQEQVSIDELTGIANLLGFTNRLEQFMGLARREKILASLVYLDIDHFKKVNDTLGHAGGDVVLKEISAFLKRSVREVDVVARIGGEEIAILLEGTDAEQAREKVEKLRKGIQALTFKGYPDFQVTASFGIVQLNGEETPEDVRAHADKALYNAKDSGRNNVQVYSAQ